MTTRIYTLEPKVYCPIDTNIAFTSKKMLYEYYGQEIVGITWNTFRATVFNDMYENASCIIRCYRCCSGKKMLDEIKHEQDTPNP